MDVRLAVSSKRDHRSFAPTPIGEGAVAAILDAGRLAGSARNRQPWRFFVATGAAARARLAPVVYVPQLLMSAPCAIAVSVRASGSAMSGFDAGRAAQNMMLAAWELGIASCPNGIAHPALAVDALGLTGDEVPVTILAFGHPSAPRDPSRRTPEAWSARARRLPLDDVTVRLG